MLRFYISEGWTKEELDKLCSQGEMYCFHPSDENPYFTLYNGAKLDLEKLKEIQNEWSLHRTYDHYPDLTDIEFIERMM